MSVAKGSDDLWVAVKCQTNPAIAGSPRNRLRASLRKECVGGRALDGLGPRAGTNPNQTPNADTWCRGVGRWGMISIVERGTTQTAR